MILKNETKGTISLLNSINDIALVPIEKSKLKIAEEFKLRLIFNIAQGDLINDCPNLI